VDTQAHQPREGVAAEGAAEEDLGVRSRLNFPWSRGVGHRQTSVHERWMSDVRRVHPTPSERGYRVQSPGSRSTDRAEHGIDRAAAAARPQQQLHVLLGWCCD
jgi:hypothetical protein